MQGMCDLVAPLLVVFDDESLSYSCFCRLMERMIENFPNGNAMDMHLANMRYISRANICRIHQTKPAIFYRFLLILLFREIFIRLPIGQ